MHSNAAFVSPSLADDVYKCKDGGDLVCEVSTKTG